MGGYVQREVAKENFSTRYASGSGFGLCVRVRVRSRTYPSELCVVRNRTATGRWWRMALPGSTNFALLKTYKLFFLASTARRTSYDHDR